jgi:hypothetical protein
MSKTDETREQAAADDAHQTPEQAEREQQEAQETVKQLEEDPPSKLEDWPADKAKYETFGGPEGEHSYEEGPEAKLGPSALTHHSDGSVQVEGKEVANPQDFKAEPIPGGPTDPESRNMRGVPDLSEVGHTPGDYNEEGDPKDPSTREGQQQRN